MLHCEVGIFLGMILGLASLPPSDAKWPSASPRQLPMQPAEVGWEEVVTVCGTATYCMEQWSLSSMLRRRKGHHLGPCRTLSCLWGSILFFR